MLCVKGRTRKQRKPVGRVKICLQSVLSRREVGLVDCTVYCTAMCSAKVEKWYPVEKSSRREAPSIRIKCQYQSIDILPLREYDQLTKYLKDEYKVADIAVHSMFQCGSAGAVQTAGAAHQCEGEGGALPRPDERLPDPGRG